MKISAPTHLRLHDHSAPADGSPIAVAGMAWARAHGMASAADHAAATQGDVPYAAGAGAWALRARSLWGRVLTTRDALAAPDWEYPDLLTVRLNRYYASNPPLKSDPANSLALGANILYAFPFLVVRRIDTARIGVVVTNASAGSIRLGLFSDNGQLYPGAAEVDWGVVPCNALGVQEIVTVTAIQRGVHWLAMVSNVTPSLGRDASDVVCAILGAGTPGGPQRNSWDVAFAFGALPANYPAGGAEQTYPPVIYVRASAAY